MYDLFSKRAHHLLHLSHNEATLLNKNYIGTEHILLAVARNPAPLVLKVLNTFHINYEIIRAEIEKTDRQRAHAIHRADGSHTHGKAGAAPVGGGSPKT